MRPMTKRTLFLLAVTTVFLLTVSDTAQAQAAVTTHSGSLADGAKYLIDVPANWNRTLFLYSHGYVTPGTPNPPQDFAKDDLDADLDTLNDTARISADPEAVRYLERNIIFNGEIHLPVLTLHTKGDGLVVVQNESAYKEVVDEAGNRRFLRGTLVDRAGHCAFTPAETIAAARTLINRLDTGRWQNVDATDLNNAAAALGRGFNIFGTPQGVVPVPPAYIKFDPNGYLRPFDSLTEE